MTVFASDALAGHAVLVTGASSGIGAAVARAAASAGAVVAANGRDEARTAAVVGQLEGFGHASVVGDVRDDPAAIVEAAVSAVGPLSGLVHAAGTHSAKPLRAVRAGDFGELFATSVIATSLLVKALRMPANRTAQVSVVLISSVVGVVGQPGVSPYAASKGAVRALSRAIAIELAPEAIRCNCLVPGMVPTPMSEGLMARMSESQRDLVIAEHPLGLGRVEDVALAALFLLSDGAAWITGSELTVDGGYTAR
jgi:NAD(P)-dependent dehydrogenase (short-subunit alcohol dehydrogenase family)